MASVSIEFKLYVPEKIALVMVKSVMPEVLTMKGRRCETDLKAEGDVIFVRLISSDLVASRAAVNTLIRLLETSYRTLGVVSGVD